MLIFQDWRTRCDIYRIINIIAGELMASRFSRFISLLACLAARLHYCSITFRDGDASASPK